MVTIRGEQVAFVLLLNLLVGCAGGERWLAANKEDVVIEGATYRVAWLRDRNGELDFRTHRNEPIVFMPDPIVEKRRNLEAAVLVAKRECRSDRTTVIIDTKDGDMFLSRLRCG